MSVRLGGGRSIQLSYGGRAYPAPPDTSVIVPVLLSPVNPKGNRRGNSPRRLGVQFADQTVVRKEREERVFCAILMIRFQNFEKVLKTHSMTRTRMTFARFRTSSITAWSTLVPRSTMV